VRNATETQMPEVWVELLSKPCMSEDYFKIVCRHSTFPGSETCRLPCSWTLERKDAYKLGKGTECTICWQDIICMHR